MAAAQLSNDTYIERMQRLAGKDAHFIRSTHQAAESWAAQKIIYEAKGMTDHITIFRTTTTQQARFYETLDYAPRRRLYAYDVQCSQTM